VIAYATLECEPGGNYFNLVVFRDGKTADNFTTAKPGEGKILLTNLAELSWTYSSH
jgi:hypothetical protein